MSIPPQTDNFVGLVDCLFFPENIFDGQDSTCSEGIRPVQPKLKPTNKKRPVQGPYQKTSIISPSTSAATIVEPPHKRPCHTVTGGVSSSDSEGVASSTDFRGDKEECRRERNRRHARETRLRKKEYMETLKSQLEQLSAQNAALEKQIKDKRLGQDAKHDLWITKLQGALALRASAEPDQSRWRNFVDDEIVLVHPITPYRSYRSADVISNRCVLMGIQDIIDDAASLLIALAGLCNEGIHDGTRNQKVQLRFNIDEQGMHYREEGIMCPFDMRSSNLTPLGLKSEVNKRGCLRAIFNSEGKVKQLELHFDPIAFWRQLQHASGAKEVLLAPNTVEGALRHSHDARVITEATRPFRITHVNAAWTELCGFTAEEAYGKTLSLIQGPKTDPDTVAKLCQDCDHGRASSMKTVNYTKQGEEFNNYLQIFPLTSSSSSGDVSHLLGVLKPTPDLSYR